MKGHKMSYNLLISHTQLQLIIQGLKLLPPGTLNLNNPDEEFLLQALESVPTVEAENPGITHGICL
jgi:hypothetical protein